MRTLHPTHSLALFGREAADYAVGEEHATSPAPVGGCWDRMADWNTKILLIGVTNTKNTFIHSIDERANLADRICPNPFRVTATDWNGNVRTYDMKHHGCSRTDDISLYYGNFEKPMVEMGVQRFGTFGDAQVRIVDAMGCRELIMKIYSRATEDIFPQHIEIPESWYKD